MRNLPTRSPDGRSTLGGEMRRIYAVMAMTAVTTFVALTTIYELFFTRQLYA